MFFRGYLSSATSPQLDVQPDNTTCILFSSPVTDISGDLEDEAVYGFDRQAASFD